MGPIYSLDDFLDMLRRRAWLILTVIMAGCLLSVVVALKQPRIYRATEVLQVTRPEISDELARSTVEGSAARRLQLIQQRLMARDSVLEIIVKYGLYADLTGLTPSERVAMLRRAVRIEGVAAAREGASDDGSVSVLSISAEMPTPRQAQQVAHEFAQRTIELSRENRIRDARETLDFLLARERSLAAEIAVLEAQISAFRNRNDMTLPGSVDFRRSEIASLNDELLTLARERIRLERAADQIDGSQRQATADRLRADIAEQLATLEAQRQLLLNRKLELEQSIETSPEIERQLGAFERQLTLLRSQMDQVSTRRSEAEVGFRLESERHGQRLTVLEPAEEPLYSVSRSRKMIAVLGGGLSVAVALVLAWLMELRNPVIRTAEQMERELGFRPVVSIPMMQMAPPQPLWRRALARLRRSRVTGDRTT
jgi:uncharacterized protein involved in exopolysaccharide biosynthesis